MFAKVKHHRVKDLKRIGLNGRETKETFMEFVSSRDARTLLSIINKRMRPGSYVYSDLW